MKGLLIDDDALFLRTLQRALARRGIISRSPRWIGERTRACQGQPTGFRSGRSQDRQRLGAEAHRAAQGAREPIPES